MQDSPAVLESYDRIVLTNEQFDAFCEICENPPPPSGSGYPDSFKTPARRLLHSLCIRQ